MNVVHAGVSFSREGAQLTWAWRDCSLANAIFSRWVELTDALCTGDLQRRQLWGLDEAGDVPGQNLDSAAMVMTVPIYTVKRETQPQTIVQPIKQK